MFSFKSVLQRVSPWLFWGLVLVYVPLCLLFVGVKWAVLPWANEYRPQLQLWASEVLGQPVEFDRVDAQWQGLRPQVVFQNVRVLDSSGGVGFSSQKVRLDWSVWGLLALSPHVSNLEVLAPIVHVNRNAAGHWVVAGHEVQSSERSYNPGLDWLLKQGRVLVKQAQVIWSDELGILPAGRAEAGELLLRNGFGRHRFALRVRSDVLGPEALDVRADFRTPLLSLHPSVWQGWRGDIFAQASVENTPMLDALMQRFGVNADVLRPQGRLWAGFRNAEVRHALLAFQVDRFELKHVGANKERAEGLAPLVVSGLRGVVDARGWLLSDVESGMPDGLMVRQLTGVLGSGEAFGPASFGFSKAEHDGGQPRWRAAFQNLDLAKSKGVVEGVLPYVGQGALLEKLRDLELSGVLRTAALSWVSRPELDVQVDLAFEGLTLLRKEPLGAGVVQWSGVQGLSGRVQGNNHSGVWQLHGAQVGVLWPKHFASSHAEFEDVHGVGYWEHLWGDQGVPRMVVNRLNVRNADAEGSVEGSVALPVDGGAVLDLKGRVLRADVSKVPVYLPLILAEKVRDWLGQALVGGLVQHGAFEIQGRLSDFPFKDKRHPGRFRVDLPFESARLHYGEGWPDVTQAKGKVVFDGAALRIHADAAEIHGVMVKHGSAEIAALGPEPSPLRISGQAEGPLNQMLRFVNESPVGDWLHQALLLAEGEGEAKVDLQLQVPLLDLKKTEVRGVLALNDNSARLMPSVPKASGLRGQVRFSNRGVFIDQLTGEALGGALSVKGETSEQGVIRIQSQGEASAAGLAAFLNPLMAPYLQGKAPYVVGVTSQAGQLEVVVNSSLQGMGLSFPAPFSKSQDAVFPVRLVHRMVPNGGGMRVALDLGEDVAQLRAAVSERRGAEGGLDSLQFAVGGGALPVPEPGVLGEVSVPVLDVDAWRAVYEQVSGRGQALNAVALSGLLGELLVVKPETKMLPTRVNVKTGRLSVGSKQFDGVALSARTIEKRWQFDVKAKGVDGYFSWVQDAMRPEGAVLARFKTLSIPKALDAGLKGLVEEPASSIPALDVQVEDFSMNQLKLGALTLKAVNQGVDERSKKGGVQREWHLDVLKIENSDSSTTAKGSWRYTPGLLQQSTDIELIQVIHNTGGFLNRLGMRDVFRGGQSRLEGRVHWNDAPMNIDYVSLGGQLKLSSKKGQFLKADPGAAKLLGVLSMQGLGRRLSLDFKDLFSQGLAYDEVEADVLLNKGIASTPNFKMKAPSVTLLMDGSLDIKAETQNLNVLVLPDLSPTGGSLVYSVVAANPAVGLVSLIADFILKDPLSKVFSIQYKVTGPWAAPVLERANQKAESQDMPLGRE